MNNPKCEWEEPAILGEGPLWVERENAVYWVDVVGKKVHRYSIEGGVRQSWTFPTEVTSLAARQSGGFVGTMRHGFAFFDFNNGTMKKIAELETDLPGNRFNDGKADRLGRFWAGTVDEAGWKAETGSLYRLERDLSVKKLDSPYVCSNGPAFSADQRTFYHSDTMKGTIYAFDFTADGEIQNKRVFARLKEGEGLPDGMTVDAEDCLWVCHFAGGRITRFSPKGEVKQVVPLPVPNVTSCTFGGAGLDRLFITTARYGLADGEVEKFPLSGSLFSVNPGVKGLPTPHFQG